MHGFLNAAERHLALLLAASVLVILIAVSYYAGGLPVYWQSTLIDDVLLWTASSLLLAVLLRLCIRPQAIALLCGAMLLYLAIGTGLLETASALLFFTACFLYGRILLWLLFPTANPPHDVTRPLLIGLAIQLTFFSALIHTPFNNRTVYAAVQLAPLLLFALTGQLPVLARQAGAGLSLQTATLTRLPYWYGVALVMLVAFVARYAFLPTLSFDDNVLHLRMWAELTFYHRYSFDVVSQVWAAAPFAVDLMHAVISLVAGTDSRAALNLLLLALLCRQLWMILAHFGLESAGCLLLVGLFVSTPMTGALLLTLQTELFLALLATAGARLVLQARAGWYTGNTIALLAVAALCCAAKLTGIMLGGLLVLALLIQLWPLRLAELTAHSVASRLFFACTLLGLAVLACNAYYTAWRITGNPVFPLYNGIFQSPYYEPFNFSDERWLTGFSLASWWSAFFATSRHFESQDFVAGFQYLFLLPLGALMLCKRLPGKTALLILLPLLGFGTVMFAATQYWRYLYPVFPLATVACGFLLLRDGSNVAVRNTTAARAAISACMVLNLWFVPGVSWLFAIAPGESYTRAERELLTWSYSPAKFLTAHVNDTAPGSRILYHWNSSSGASLHGQPVYIDWFSPSRLAKLRTIEHEADIRAFLDDESIDYVIWNMEQVGPPDQAQWWLKELLSSHGRPVLQASGDVLYQLRGRPLAWQEIIRLDDVQATTARLGVANLTVPGASRARVRVSVACSDPAGILVAEIHWNQGPPYRRDIPCTVAPFEYAEALPVPGGATAAEIVLSVRAASAATVTSLVVETD
jgi:hypothetical protein